MIWHKHQPKWRIPAWHLSVKAKVEIPGEGKLAAEDEDTVKLKMTILSENKLDTIQNLRN